MTDDTERMVALLGERDLEIAEFHAMQLPLAAVLTKEREARANAEKGWREMGEDAAKQAARAESAEAEAKRLTALINTPELHDFIKAVPLEAVHQRERWGSDHDDGKTPADWFWLLGYLGGKALRSHLDGDTTKALHHTITAAAALANWHSNILGKTNMRPGIANPDSAFPPSVIADDRARTALAKREGGEG